MIRGVMMMDFGIAVTCWLCALIIGVCALWISKRRKPIHFFTGSTVEPEEVTDIPAYNRANALMWTIYAACFVVVGTLSFFNSIAGLILMLVLFIPCIIPMYFFHKRIYKKYKRIDNAYTKQF
jgi:uncharacterized membrane protein YjjB (DUF3815 family)